MGAERVFRREGTVSGLISGLRDLDGKMGGMHSSDLLILAGGPAWANPRGPSRSPSARPKRGRPRPG
jgi:hypothetical protein